MSATDGHPLLPPCTNFFLLFFIVVLFDSFDVRAFWFVYLIDWLVLEMSSSPVVTPEDVLETLMNDGTIDAIRLKIIHHLKANEELKNTITKHFNRVLLNTYLSSHLSASNNFLLLCSSALGVLRTLLYCSSSHSLVEPR